MAKSTIQTMTAEELLRRADVAGGMMQVLVRAAMFDGVERAKLEADWPGTTKAMAEKSVLYANALVTALRAPA